MRDHLLMLTAVYATHIREIAIAFAALMPLPEKGRSSWRLSIEQDGSPQIKYLAGRPNLGGVGYVYRLPSETFEPLDEYQWVSFVPVVPVDIMVPIELNYIVTEGVAKRLAGLRPDIRDRRPRQPNRDSNGACRAHRRSPDC